MQDYNKMVDDIIAIFLHLIIMKKLENLSLTRATITITIVAIVIRN